MTDVMRNNLHCRQPEGARLPRTLRSDASPDAARASEGKLCFPCSRIHGNRRFPGAGNLLISSLGFHANPRSAGTRRIQGIRAQEFVQDEFFARSDEQWRGASRPLVASKSCTQRKSKSNAARSRRGQVEMVGLVIIVALLIVGIVLYMSFSAKAGKLRASASRTQGSTDFVDALAATYIPACEVKFYEAAQACIEGKAIGACSRPCDKLQDTVDAVAAAALQGERYNLSITGTAIQSESGCPSGNQQLNGVTESPTPIQLGNGIRATLVLALCR